MNNISRNLKYILTACVTAIIGLAAVTAYGQTAVAKDKDKDKNKTDYSSRERSFCSNNNWSDNDRTSFSDLREMTILSTASLNVDAGQNGGISVKGEDRSDVLVRACVQTWGSSDEAAKAAAANIKIGTSGEIRADGPSGDKNWSVSYQILAPRATNINLTAHNGGISISGIDSSAEFETQNGGINLNDVAGSFKGRTTNGGVNVTLTGSTWKGSGLDLQTTNGGVRLTMPENYAARVETGTVNGGFRSEIPALNITTEEVKGGDWSHSKAKRIVTNINGGGPSIKVITTNGGVSISTPN